MPEPPYFHFDRKKIPLLSSGPRHRTSLDAYRYSFFWFLIYKMADDGCQAGTQSAKNTACHPKSDIQGGTGASTGDGTPEETTPTSQESSPAGTRARADSQRKETDLDPERAASPERLMEEALMKLEPCESEYQPSPKPTIRRRKMDLAKKWTKTRRTADII